MEKILGGGRSGVGSAGKFARDLEGKIMATLFYEPSTRTRFSFEAAMLRLGGRVLSNADMMQTSSVTKLETLKDTGKVVSQMVDVIVMRHPEPGVVNILAETSDVPVINAGDGPNEHPTQGLLDLYTIWKEFGKIDGLTIGMIGDLKNSRVQHSQVGLLKHFKVKFVLVSPRGLEMPSAILEEMAGDSRRHSVLAAAAHPTRHGALASAAHPARHGALASGESAKVVLTPEDAVEKADVISVSRIQKERFVSESEYRKYAGSLVVDAELMKKAKKGAIVIHPLPRVDEIAVEVDDDPRARYFNQVRNGVAVRMALLKMIFNG